MSDANLVTPRQDSGPDDSLGIEIEIEKHLQETHQEPDAINACRKKLWKDSRSIRILERLTDRGAGLVDDAVDTLIQAPTTRESRVYQSFLHDILRHLGPGFLVLTAASLGKQRVVHLSAGDRIDLFCYIKDTKAELHCPALDSLAEEYEVPALNGLKGS